MPRTTRRPIPHLQNLLHNRGTQNTLYVSTEFVLVVPLVNGLSPTLGFTDINVFPTSPCHTTLPSSLRGRQSFRK